MTIAAVERAMDVLLFISRAETASVGITEIADGLGMSKAVVHRIVTSLKVSGFVEADQETRRYSLGPSCLAVGKSYVDRLNLRDIAREPMKRLVEATNETATLSIRDGWERLYIDQITPDREVLMSIRIGQPYPLHAGSSSKAFLAFLGEEEIESYIEQAPLDQVTENTIVDPDQLRKELEAIRERGYAFSLGERQVGAASVAAPIVNNDGRPVAAMSVCGPLERFRHHIESVSELLLEETRLLSRYWGW